MSELTTEQRERIQDFVAALRSGEYEQVSEQLGKACNDVKSYCCEGVAVERYASQVGYTSSWIDDRLCLINADGVESVDFADDEFWESLALSTGVDNGTSTVFAFVMPGNTEVRNTGATAISFMALNDEGLTFSQIADIIEWQFLSR